MIKVDFGNIAYPFNPAPFGEWNGKVRGIELPENSRIIPGLSPLPDSTSAVFQKKSCASPSKQALPGIKEETISLRSIRRSTIAYIAPGCLTSQIKYSPIPSAAGSFKTFNETGKRFISKAILIGKPAAVSWLRASPVVRRELNSPVILTGQTCNPLEISHLSQKGDW